MKKMINLMLALITGLILIGCGATAKEIRAKSLSERSDVFHEVKEEGAPPNGFVDVVIKASIKTHLEGYYLLEPDTRHGKPEYPFVLNIDGQAVTWEVAGQVEDSTKYDEKGGRNPEGGKGMRYVLIKELQLKPGLHKIFFALPGENKSVEVTITLNERELSVLEFKPIYYRYDGRPTFEKGVSRFEVFLNERLIQ